MPAIHHRVVIARLVIPIPAGVNLEALLGQVFKDLQAKGFIKMAPSLPMSPAGPAN